MRKLDKSDMIGVGITVIGTVVTVIGRIWDQKNDEKKMDARFDAYMKKRQTK